MKKQSGMTIVELLVAMAIMGIGLGIASLILQPIESPLNTGANLLEGLFRQARMEAIATTSAYRISPENPYVLGSEYAPSCLAGVGQWTSDSTVKLQLPEGVEVSDQTWSVCFTSRGISNTNQIIQLEHEQYGTVQVEVLLGGTTRILE